MIRVSRVKLTSIRHIPNRLLKRRRSLSFILSTCYVFNGTHTRKLVSLYVVDPFSYSPQQDALINVKLNEIVARQVWNATPLIQNQLHHFANCRELPGAGSLSHGTECFCCRNVNVMP